VRKATAQHKKMRYSAFYELLEVLGCPIAGNLPGRKLLAQSLDLPGCGFVSKADLQWLDKWSPPEWLCEEADQEAWEHFRARIQRIYPHPLAAWRKLLDVDSSNSVSWSEFTEAAARVGYRGNVAGAWRALDSDLSGTITMKEYDHGSALLLESFKEWAEANFGSVRHAFKAMDDDGNSLVGFSEMKRACQRLHWHGDVRLLFDCLDVDGKLDGGKRFLSMREVIFLDHWHTDMSNTYAIKKAMMDSIMAETTARSPSPRSPSDSMSSSMFRSSSAPTLPSLPARPGSGGGVDSPGLGELSPSSAMRAYQSQSAFKTPKKQRRMKKQWYHKIMSPDGALPAYSGL
jgi:Ca2+-binding EF-hand superfamily protein